MKASDGRVATIETRALIASGSIIPPSAPLPCQLFSFVRLGQRLLGKTGGPSVLGGATVLYLYITVLYVASL